MLNLGPFIFCDSTFSPTPNYWFPFTCRSSEHVLRFGVDPTRNHRFPYNSIHFVPQLKINPGSFSAISRCSQTEISDFHMNSIHSDLYTEAQSRSSFWDFALSPPGSHWFSFAKQFTVHKFVSCDVVLFPTQNWNSLAGSNRPKAGSNRLRDHPGRVQGWESVCWGVLGIPLLENEKYLKCHYVLLSCLCVRFFSFHVWFYCYVYVFIFSFCSFLFSKMSVHWFSKNSTFRCPYLQKICL